MLNNIQFNNSIVLKQKDAIRERIQPVQPSFEFFTDISNENGIDFKHRDTIFYDYNYQGLLPQKFSQLGPFITEGDVNGDGLTDFFVGGAFFQSGRIYTQDSNGLFTSTELVSGKKIEEDLGTFFFDADGDDDNDFKQRNACLLEVCLGIANMTPLATSQRVAIQRPHDSPTPR